jgi:hypothetical protein
VALLFLICTGTYILHMREARIEIRQRASSWRNLFFVQKSYHFSATRAEEYVERDMYVPISAMQIHRTSPDRPPETADGILDRSLQTTTR